jgi:hypothetical protein
MRRLTRHNAVMRPLGALLLAAFAVVFCPGLPPALARARPDLDRAQEHYDFAEYGVALTILDGMIARGDLTGDTLRDAKILKARCLVGLGRDSEALDAWCEVIKLDPAWRPDEVFFPGNEIASFNRALEGCVEKESAAAPWYKNKIVMAGAGALVLVGVLAVAMGGGGDDGGGGGNALPGFPDPPEGP